MSHVTSWTGGLVWSVRVNVIFQLFSYFSEQNIFNFNYCWRATLSNFFFFFFLPLAFPGAVAPTVLSLFNTSTSTPMPLACCQNISWLIFRPIFQPAISTFISARDVLKSSSHLVFFFFFLLIQRKLWLRDMRWRTLTRPMRLCVIHLHQQRCAVTLLQFTAWTAATWAPLQRPSRPSSRICHPEISSKSDA